MSEDRAEVSTRRRALKVLSSTACIALVVALAGCTAGSTKSWQKPAWMRSKRGSNGNGGGRNGGGARS
jgi:hypothetical protein